MKYLFLILYVGGIVLVAWALGGSIQGSHQQVLRAEITAAFAAGAAYQAGIDAQNPSTSDYKSGEDYYQRNFPDAH